MQTILSCFVRRVDCQPSRACARASGRRVASEGRVPSLQAAQKPKGPPPAPSILAFCAGLALGLWAGLAAGAELLPLDQAPAGPGEWGYRPGHETVSAVNPPAFCWRPQQDITGWEVQCARDAAFEEPVHEATRIQWNVHTPPQAFAPGEYFWRYRGRDASGRATQWSRARRFSIPQDARALPMPRREELLERIPKTHPRLFVRPEDLPRLRGLAAGELKDRYEQLVKECDRLLADPPPTAEPPKYPADVERKSERWREIWWGNRVYTIRALNGAATLGFTWRLSGNEQYGRLARRILLDCARWDPQGATGYRYNDEAGMPYAYYFARTYSFVNDLLTEDEREQCRAVMRVRGEEMYRHLCPRHLWRPYASHSNRAWHFLGEVGIAFKDEIPGADDWVWFAANVFYNVYPVWSDDDGGWHEGSSYWSSYIGRFTWWADAMRAAMGIDAYRKPYFSQVGYYPMYLLPPGKTGGGFGDLCAPRKAAQFVPLVSQLAAQAGNGHWQWYVEQMGGPKGMDGYVGFVRGSLPPVAPESPDDLPPSRLFRGTGQAVLNTTLFDAGDDVQVVFKSSPFGTQSHGYEANNSFLLWAYGQRLLVRSGYRDIYGSDHHRGWMWSTRSVNNITVDGHGQLAHSAASQGRITAFETTPRIDVVAGEAGEAYRTKAEIDPDALLLRRFSRAIVFIKPDLVVIYDRLAARQPATFQYWLHATEQFDVRQQRDIRLRVGEVGCRIALLEPAGLELRQTDQYDPNPRPRITLREWHLTAATTERREQVEFVALYRPHRAGQDVPAQATLRRDADAWQLEAALPDGHTARLSLPLSGERLSVQCLDENGRGEAQLAVDLQ